MSELPGLIEERKRLVLSNSSRIGMAMLMGLATGVDIWSTTRPANPRKDFGMPVATRVNVNFSRGPGKKRGKRK